MPWGKHGWGGAWGGTIVPDLPDSTDDPTYHYVNSLTGSDSNDGTFAAPWQTLAPVMSHVLNPGDSVFLNRGGSFTPATGFVVNQSGIEGAPITFSTYGSGDRPIIVGPGSGAVGFNLTNRSYIVVMGLNVQCSASANYGFAMNPAHHITLINCESSGTLYGPFMGYGGPTVVHDITLTGCIAYDGATFGITFDNTGGPGPDSITVQDCTAYNNGTNTSGHHGIYLKYTTNSLVDGNTCYGNASGGIKINQEGVAGACAGTIVSNNYCYSNWAGIWASADSVSYYNNLIKDSSGIGFYILNDADDCDCFHNTIINTTYWSIRFSDGATNSGWTFKNNLLVQDPAVIGANRECIRVSGDGSAIGANNTWDYNQYWTDGHTTLVSRQSGASLDLAGWQALAGEANSANSDPVFVAEFTDLHLTLGSPAIARGDPAVGVLTDFDGVTRGAAVDAGCYEYVE